MTGDLNGVTNSFTFELVLKTPCDLSSFVSITTEAKPVDVSYIITSFTEAAPYSLPLPNPIVVTTPFQHDWCGPVDLKVYFQDNQEVDGPVTITPFFEVLRYDEVTNSLDIFSTNPELIGIHSIKLVYTLRDYNVISFTDYFTIDFLDPCEEPGYSFVDTTAQSDTPIFTYSGSDESYDISVLFVARPSFCALTYSSCTLETAGVADLCTINVNSFDSVTGILTLNTLDVVAFPIGLYQFTFEASIESALTVTGSETYSIEFQDPCLFQDSLTLPTGGPFIYEYILSDDTATVIDMMVS